MEDLLEKGRDALKENSIITGGHFRLFFREEKIEPKINEGTVLSFKACLELFSISRSIGLKTDIGILINDMGSACDDQGCSLGKLDFSRDAFDLPETYLDLLEGKGLSQADINIYWEKHIRNRAKKDFLKILKKKESRIKKGLNGYSLYTEKVPSNKIMLTRTQGKDKYGVPACPLIMGELDYFQSSKYDNCINYYYIGNDNLENIPNYFVIEKARPVAEFLGSKMSIKNIYFDRPRLG